MPNPVPRPRIVVLGSPDETVAVDAALRAVGWDTTPAVALADADLIVLAGRTSALDLTDLRRHLPPTRDGDRSLVAVLTDPAPAAIAPSQAAIEAAAQEAAPARAGAILVRGDVSAADLGCAIRYLAESPAVTGQTILLAPSRA